MSAPSRSEMQAVRAENRTALGLGQPLEERAEGAGILKIGAGLIAGVFLLQVLQERKVPEWLQALAVLGLAVGIRRWGD